MASALGSRQLPNDQALRAISVTPVRTPRLSSRAIEMSFASPPVTGARPAPGNGRVVPETLTKRAKVGPVTPGALGTWIDSVAAAGLKAISPCQPLHR